MKRLLVVIPAYNEEVTLLKVIRSVPTTILNYKTFVVVIDDGSVDDTTRVLKKNKIPVIKHILNRGLGAALATGFVYARHSNAHILVTLDADGQHNANDIKRLILPIVNQSSEVVVGSRLLLKGGMPITRYMVNFLSNLITYVLFGVWTTDSQSGFRAFSNKAIKNIRIRSQRMEVSSEIFKEIARLRLRMTEIPIRAIYTDYSLKKGQKISNAPNVFWKLLLHRFA